MKPVHNNNKQTLHSKLSFSLLLLLFAKLLRDKQQCRRYFLTVHRSPQTKPPLSPPLFPVTISGDRPNSPESSARPFRCLLLRALRLYDQGSLARFPPPPLLRHLLPPSMSKVKCVSHNVSLITKLFVYSLSVWANSIRYRVYGVCEYAIEKRRKKLEFGFKRDIEIFVFVGQCMFICVCYLGSL